MLSIYRNMFKIPDLRGKIFFTLAMFAVYRWVRPSRCPA